MNEMYLHNNEHAYAAWLLHRMALLEDMIADCPDGEVLASDITYEYLIVVRQVNDLSDPIMLSFFTFKDGGFYA